MRLLAILPATRAVALRYERDKRAIFRRDAPIAAAEAFTGSAISRIGHHNDCFLASEDDWATYRPTKDRSIAAAKAYLAAENRYVPQGGETCNIAADAQPYVHCNTALKELADQHWSQLNSDYHLGVLALWKREGCYAEISRRLGYRLRLVRSSYPAAAIRGGVLKARIVLVNDGFAAPYNSRPVELVLRASSGPAIRMSIPQDPRRWLPGAPISLNVAVKLPRGAAPGIYRAYLLLPDPEPRLRSRADYAIRLANRNSWLAQTGENALNWNVEVK
jgi:hypothetical protein